MKNDTVALKNNLGSKNLNEKSTTLLRYIKEVRMNHCPKIKKAEGQLQGVMTYRSRNLQAEISMGTGVGKSEL